MSYPAKILFKRLKDGEDLIEAIEKIATEAGIKTALLTVIGMVKNPLLAYYAGPEKGYAVNKLEGVYELVSCIGNLTLLNGKPFIHLHAVVANEKAKPKAGHLLKGTLVSNTCELAIVVAEGLELKRKRDEKTGLYLLQT